MTQSRIAFRRPADSNIPLSIWRKIKICEIHIENAELCIDEDDIDTAQDQVGELIAQATDLLRSIRQVEMEDA